MHHIIFKNPNKYFYSYHQEQLEISNGKPQTHKPNKIPNTHVEQLPRGGEGQHRDPDQQVGHRQRHDEKVRDRPQLRGTEHRRDHQTVPYDHHHVDEGEHGQRDQQLRLAPGGVPQQRRARGRVECALHHIQLLPSSHPPGNPWLSRRVPGERSPGTLTGVWGVFRVRLAFRSVAARQMGPLLKFKENDEVASCYLNIVECNYQSCPVECLLSLRLRWTVHSARCTGRTFTNLRENFYDFEESLCTINSALYFLQSSLHSKQPLQRLARGFLNEIMLILAKKQLRLNPELELVQLLMQLKICNDFKRNAKKGTIVNIIIRKWLKRTINLVYKNVLWATFPF